MRHLTIARKSRIASRGGRTKTAELLAGPAEIGRTPKGMLSDRMHHSLPAASRPAPEPRAEEGAHEAADCPPRDTEGAGDGDAFTARKTGIYCRACCPSRRTKTGDAVRFASAAAAQAAGFRPCLRCRPELAPELAPWRQSETLARAIALLASGHFDTHRLAALASRLNVSESQLRRLFRKHYGASPRKIEAARRMLFAKQLVTDTALPTADVARACGLGGAAHCNARFRRLYGRSVAELRRRSTLSQTGSGLELILPYKPPYDWNAMIAFLAPRAIRGVEEANRESYARSITLGGMSGTIVVRPARGQSGLRARIHFPSLEFLPAIVDRIRCLFDLGADPMVISRQLAKDALLAPLVAMRPGVRVPGAWDGFEIAVRAILGQEVTVKAASIFAGRLAMRYGEPLAITEGERSPGLTHLFPRPERIAEANDLATTVGLPRKRAAAIIRLGEAVAADPTLLSLGANLKESIARLVALPGIGQWTAHYIAMRVLHERDAFPAADVGLLRMMADANGRPKPRDLLARAASWQPWRAYAVMQLWTSASLLSDRGDAKGRAKDDAHTRGH